MAYATSGAVQLIDRDAYEESRIYKFVETSTFQAFRGEFPFKEVLKGTWGGIFPGVPGANFTTEWS